MHSYLIYYHHHQNNIYQYFPPDKHIPIALQMVASLFDQFFSIVPHKTSQHHANKRLLQDFDCPRNLMDFYQSLPDIAPVLQDIYQ